MTEAAKHTPALLPCPFCGSEPRAWEDCDMGYSRYGRFWWNVCCVACDVGFRDREEFDDQGLLKHPAQECFTRWNARAFESQERLIETLTEALEPFATRADRYNEIPGILLIHDDVELWQIDKNKGMEVDIAVGDLRRARTALAQARKQNP